MARTFCPWKARSIRAWTLSFSVRTALRRLKPQRSLRIHVPRNDAELSFVEQPVGTGPDLLLDSCVYMDVFQRRVPPDVKDLLRQRILNHSSVALSELTHAFGRLDPKRSDTPRTLVALETAVCAIPPNRLTRPSTAAYGEAGMLAGMAARMFGRAHGIELLNDALLLLHAGATGRVLLTRNVRDFDLLQQLAPWTRFLAYR